MTSPSDHIDPAHIDPALSEPTGDPLDIQALEWLRRLTSGQATQADSEALDLWRNQSPDHARAFAEAALMWNVTAEATQDALRRNPALLAKAPPKAGFNPGRRTVLAGGTALAAALVGGLAIRPPLDLWPSLPELDADYRTGPGQRRQFAATPSILVDMNTRTSLDVRPATDAAQEIELIAGEAAITKTRHAVQQVVVHAGQAIMRATKASFSVRREDGVVGVTCVDGEVDVEGGGSVRSLRSGQRVLCDEQGVGEVVAVDPASALAWQRGLLIFEDVPLANAIDEINRYRTGRIILTDAKLGGRRIVASFRLDRIDAALDFVTDVLHVPARRLPGGIVLLG